MFLLAALLIMGLSPLAIVSLTPGSYLITFPQRCYLGTSNNFSVQIWTQSDVQLNLVLKKEDQETVIFDQSVPAEFPGRTHVLPFELPLLENSHNYQLWVRASGGITFNGSVSTYLSLRPQTTLLIQTDKPIYKPGQKVLFRVLGIDPNLKPLSDKETYNVSVTDGGGSRVLQWTNVTMLKGFLSLEFTLTARPVLGVWTIGVESSSKLSAARTIEVSQYVLPKFEVTVKSLGKLAPEDTIVPLEVCSRYTYGQPVLGNATVHLCLGSRFFWSRVPESCMTYTKQMKGCDMLELSLSQLENVDNFYYSSFTAIASFAEEGTGVVINSTQISISFAQNEVELSFQDTPSSYKPGIPLTVKVKATPGTSKSPRVFTVNCSVTSGSKVFYVQVQIENGKGLFEILTKDLTDPISLMVTYESPFNQVTPFYGKSTASWTVAVWISPSLSYLNIRPVQGPVKVGSLQNIAVDYKLNGTIDGSINYMLYCTGRLRTQGFLAIPLSEQVDVHSGYVDQLVYIEKDAAPLCRLIVMTTMDDGEVVADSAELTVEEKLPNSVKLEFSSTEEKPGSTATLTVSASAGSRYAVVGVDSSVDLLRASADFGISDVLSIRRQMDMSGGSYYGYSKKCATPWRRKRGLSYYPDFGNRRFKDSNAAFQATGLSVLTNLKLDAAPCENIPMVLYGLPLESIEMSVTGARTSQADGSIRVRKDFPETWLWLDGFVGNDSKGVHSVTVPDTITSWAVRGFAVSDVDGVGFAVPTSLKVFQPFFLSLTLPYSAVRMERVTIPMSIFNYLDSCLTVNIVVAASKQFKLVRRQYGLVGIEAQQSAVYTFTIQPLVLGHITVRVQADTARSHAKLCQKRSDRYQGPYIGDIVEEKLLIEPPGVKQYRVNNSFVCLRGKAQLEQLSIQLPKNTVPDSVHATFSLVGDVMGPSMSNIGELIRMPYGCGEQNMINFAPNIYILQYLQATGQNQEDVITKAKNFMVQGYQRQLSYKRSDGSYAAFGQREPHGSTWLTAFVVKSFSQAKPFVFIDTKDIMESIRYLLAKQGEDGCFIESGEVHDKFIMGGMNGDGTLLTAFVLNALLESDLTSEHQAVSSGLKCLLSKSETITSSYGLAVMAYTLSLAQHPQAEKILSQLWEKAIIKNGQTWWSSPQTSNKPTPYSWFNWQAKPCDIETAGYALMATLKHDGKTDVVNRGVGVIRWLSRQRNSLGGFASTQDTCVAMQSLAAFSEVTYGSAEDMSVEVTPNVGAPFMFSINRLNKVLLQQSEITAPPTLNISLKGDGCVLLQASVDFNIFSIPAAKVFTIEVSVAKSQVPSCSPALTVCASYLLGDETNMALVEVHLWTGFTVALEDLDRAMVPGFTLQQFEVDGGKLTLYFSKMTKERTCITFRLIRTSVAEAIASKPVSVYDYYDNQRITTVMNSFKRDFCP